MRVFVLIALLARAYEFERKHHHHRRHHYHHWRAIKEEPEDPTSTSAKAEVLAAPAKTLAEAPTLQADTPVAPAPPTEAAAPAGKAPETETDILKRIQELERQIAEHETQSAASMARGRIDVNGPLPADFNKVFADAVAKATGCSPSEVTVVHTHPVGEEVSFLQTVVVIEVIFQAPTAVVEQVEAQAADPTSALVTGSLRNFLMAREQDGGRTRSVPTPTGGDKMAIDIDTDMPYGELKPFGREDTAQELTEDSIKESDRMVDQMERAEVAEEKRAVFRALTRLRGAAITSYDGVARAQTGNIDEYNKIHKWRKTHPLRHLAAEESDVSKWAFPDNADF